MAVVLALSGFLVLVVALVLFVRTSKDATASGATSNRRALMILVGLGLVLGLASQLPIFR